MATDFYSVLGVAKDADAATIKKSYRKLARDLHPDKNPGNKALETRFKEVNRAYEVLGDDAKRKLYDEFGEDALREGFDPEKQRAYAQWQSRAANGGGGFRGGGGGVGGAVKLEDLFSGAVPGGWAGGGAGAPFAELVGRASRRRGPGRGRDHEPELTVDFVSAVRGTSLQLRNPSSPEPVTVRIPPGAAEGSRVRIKGQGAASPNGGPNGDLILVIHVEPHPLFTRDGDDLTLEVPITASEAIKGAKVKVPTFDGDVQVKVPAGTQSGTKLRLRGKGVVRKGRDPGDLYVRFMVHVPSGTDPKLQALADELAKLEHGDVRANLHI
ncbi:MAG: J domain-containing protein [Polyangiales bacterium]